MAKDKFKRIHDNLAQTEIRRCPMCKPFYLLKDLEEVNINILKCEGIEYNNCDQRLFYLEECFCKKAINENPKVQEIYNKWLKLEF